MFNPWITRYMKDLDRLKTIQAVIDRDMKPGMAAQRLGMSVRQIERLVIRYRADGPVGLISRHRQLQIGVGLWIPRKLRPPKIQQPRMRRACIGELIQIDGCEHHWFEDRGPACTALVFIESSISWPIRQPIESTPANISM
jgi:hypothetical protein